MYSTNGVFWFPDGKKDNTQKKNFLVSDNDVVMMKLEKKKIHFKNVTKKTKFITFKYDFKPIFVLDLYYNGCIAQIL
jgi:hypothetical protein